METKTYRLYLDIEEPNSSGNYISIFAGSASGNIDSGAMTVSNKTSGVGNLNGFIHPETKGVFTVLKTLGVFISTDGHRMTFQNKLGGNALTFIRSFLEFVLQEEIVSIEGDVYEAVDLGKKGFLVVYIEKNGQEGRATMTNATAKGVLKKTGKVIAAPVLDNVTAFSKGGTTAEKVGAVVGDVVTAAGLAVSLLDGETTSPLTLEAGEVSDKYITKLAEYGIEATEEHVTQIESAFKELKAGQYYTDEQFEKLARKLDTVMNDAIKQLDDGDDSMKYLKLKTLGERLQKKDINLADLTDDLPEGSESMSYKQVLEKVENSLKTDPDQIKQVERAMQKVDAPVKTVGDKALEVGTKAVKSVKNIVTNKKFIGGYTLAAVDDTAVNNVKKIGKFLHI